MAPCSTKKGESLKVHLNWEASKCTLTMPQLQGQEHLPDKTGCVPEVCVGIGGGGQQERGTCCVANWQLSWELFSEGQADCHIFSQNSLEATAGNCLSITLGFVDNSCRHLGHCHTVTSVHWNWHCPVRGSGHATSSPLVPVSLCSDLRLSWMRYLPNLAENAICYCCWPCSFQRNSLWRAAQRLGKVGKSKHEVRSGGDHPFVVIMQPQLCSSDTLYRAIV